MKPNKKKTLTGFTLIELLVSMVITTIIVTVLVTVTVTSLNIWNRSRAEVRASMQSKAMIDSMAADFESMVVRRGNNFQWLFARFAPPTEGPNGNLSPTALDLIFFSAATDRYNGRVGEAEDLGGDISTIGYQLVYKDPIGSEDEEKYKTFALYRKIVDPKPTFDNLLGQANLKTAFDTYTANSNEVDAVENFVCENVYQFTVKFHIDVVENNVSKSVAVTLDANQQFIVTGNGLTSPNAPGVTDAAVMAAGRLTAVEVSLSVITDAGIKQLRGRNFTDQQLSDFIAENSYQYSKVIPVPSY